MQILLIDNYDSFTYNIVEQLRTFAEAHVTICQNDRIAFEDLRQYTHIILSPGPKIPKQSGDLLQLIEATKHTHPILGICLGHQAIAQVFGAGLIQLEHPLHGYQTSINLTAEHSLFDGIKMPMQIGLYHSWVVDATTISTDMECTSFSPEGYVMSIRHKNLPIHGVQFHPESYMTPDGLTIIKNFLAIHTKAL